VLLDDWIAAQFHHPDGWGGRLVHSIGSRQNQGLYQATLDRLAIEDADTVLDAGCGNGALLALMTAHPGVSLIGVDSSPTMIRAARRRLARQVRSGRARLLEGDLARLPLLDGSCTKAVSVNTSYFWHDAPAVLGQVRRVLAAGGLFVNAAYTNTALGGLSHTGSGYLFHDPDALASAAVAAGFSARVVPVMRGSAYHLVCLAA
jgi:ubiquinone/menaquinone biosynthesis C-methylase UbiE